MDSQQSRADRKGAHRGRVLEAEGRRTKRVRSPDDRLLSDTDDVLVLPAKSSTTGLHAMMPDSNRGPWQIWSNVLSILGVGGCMAIFLWLFGLIGYYSFQRPREPMPERGWTEPLHWTHGSYGTHAENEQLLRLQRWSFPFVLVGGAAAWMKMRYKQDGLSRAQ